ncbi:MAG: heme A synthase [Alphaproteobacteria bacterium]|nr:heme A synthase [Alphaproteobacteria bacterium]
MVAAMILLGGATRLTESGLSIVNWRPVTGILPPLNDAEWQALFAAYKNSPEFAKVNFWMTVTDFKSIYWLEYLHRLWGRLIGVVFLLPYLWFVMRRIIPAALTWRLGGLFILGGVQGLVGWYMVKSGLVNEPAVSQYRLAAHLGLAFIIFGLLFWYAAACLTQRPTRSGTRWIRTGSTIILWAAAVTIIWGAFVAGLDAGLAYNTFPLMGGRLVPEGILNSSPWWINFFENTATVQFTHRVLAIGTVALVLAYWASARHSVVNVFAQKAIMLLGVLAVCQLGLGIVTLLTEVILALGMLHQLGALAVITSAIWLRFTLGD